MPALQGPSDTCLCPSSYSTAARSHNPSLMSRRRRLLCPLALWISKVLLWLSARVNNIDLNSLTRLISDGSTFSPQPLNSSSHCICSTVVLYSQWSWKPAQPVHCTSPCPNKLNHRKGMLELKMKKWPMSQQFNYPPPIFEALRNSRLDLVSLIPARYKYIPDLCSWPREGGLDRANWQCLSVCHTVELSYEAVVCCSQHIQYTINYYLKT